jgi:DNA-directed RNA polymerase subunit RPC12/RpoP
MAKLIKKGKKWVCSNCKKVADEWQEAVSPVVFVYSFDAKGNLEIVDKDYLGEVEVFCVYCGAEFEESLDDIHEKVKHNCTII